MVLESLTDGGTSFPDIVYFIALVAIYPINYLTSYKLYADEK